MVGLLVHTAQQVWGLEDILWRQFLQSFEEHQVEP
jgi:hypothetical protein